MSSSAESGNEKCFRVSKKNATPSPRRNAKSLLKPVLSPAKEDGNSKCSSASTSSGSGDDSGTSTPNDSVVANGSSNVSADAKATNASKDVKPGGRLKFFKDGILCLELSHHDEGEKTKWVQIKTKTVIPAIVHTTKEATIPCHLAPSAFSSPSAGQNLRVESSTSHSMSDDGSSMLSSPRDRENTWKQSVPIKGVSICHEFYMKPAECILKYRRNVGIKTLFRFRRPYSQMPQLDKVEIVCSCVGFTGKNLKLPNGEIDEANNETDLVTPDLSSKNRPWKIKADHSLEELTENLKRVAESRCEVVKLNDQRNCESKAIPLKSNLITPKKRVFKDVETRDSNFRPKKKSPSGSIEKTILTIPGLNSEFYKRHISTVTNDLPSSAYTDRSDRPGEVNSKAVNLTKASCKNKNRIHSSHSLNSSSTSMKNRRSPNLGAKSVSTSKHLLNTPELLSNPLIFNPNQMVKSAISLSNYCGRSSSSPKAKSRASALESEKEQQLFQQQTMSKAISYTINSLLGTGNAIDNAFDSADANNLYNGKLYSGSKKSSTKSQSAPAKSKTGSKLVTNDHTQAKNRGSFSENDQNSFLRHLLDTSDPIPSTKTERSAIISNKSLKSSSTSSNHSSSRNVSNSTSTANKSVTKSPSKPVSNSSSRSSTPPHHNSRQSLQSHLLPPISADVSAYSNLFRPDSTAAFAAAAAAFHHYNSLLPAAFFPNFNNAAAAAAAASYLVPNPAAVAASSSTPTVPQLPFGSNNVLNLSQNIWPSFLPGSSIHPFGGSISDELNSLSAIQRRNSSSPYFDANPSDRGGSGATSSSIDNDAPLNLCKKTRPN